MDVKPKNEWKEFTPSYTDVNGTDVPTLYYKREDRKITIRVRKPKVANGNN